MSKPSGIDYSSWSKLIVIVNKMDEESVKLSKERYDNIVKILKPFIHSCRFDVEKNVKWIFLD